MPLKLPTSANGGRSLWPREPESGRPAENGVGVGSEVDRRVAVPVGVGSCLGVGAGSGVGRRVGVGVEVGIEPSVPVSKGPVVGVCVGTGVRVAVGVGSGSGGPVVGVGPRAVIRAGVAWAATVASTAA